MGQVEPYDADYGSSVSLAINANYFLEKSGLFNQDTTEKQFITVGYLPAVYSNPLENYLGFEVGSGASILEIQSLMFKEIDYPTPAEKLYEKNILTSKEDELYSFVLNLDKSADMYFHPDPFVLPSGSFLWHNEKEGDIKSSAEIDHFCDKYNIKEYFSEVTSIIKSCFPDIQNWDVDIISDPETDENEWISIEISISGEISDILERYDQYTDMLISKIPWTSRDKISLTYNILGK